MAPYASLSLPLFGLNRTFQFFQSTATCAVPDEARVHFQGLGSRQLLT